MLELVVLQLTDAEVKVEKTDVPEKVDVSITIDDIKIKEEKALLYFTYSINYSPKVAKVDIKGVAYCADSPENLKKVAADWKKKVVSPDLGMNVLNEINGNVGMNSIFIMRPFNLVPPFTPPLIIPTEEKKKK